ncbi:MAG: Hsp70 family protein [Spirochaetaceae bacterium]|nr:Hsp70 family protein [Spirochaetaceae bacterium]GMO29458.1 MAG: LysM peptidoglycan-binding domain-containing protein [Termitinemataceae bacterium]
MSSSIGIKIANGEFYPILSENKPAKKRMVLTTVHDGQKSVQIDLYRSEARGMSDAQYIGSLVVEKIKNKKKGEASVELIVARDNAGEIFAEAKDLDNPKSAENAKLSVSLASMEGNADIDFSNIGLGDSESVTDVMIQKNKTSKLPLILAVTVLGLIIVAFAVWWFAFGGAQMVLKGGSESISIFEALKEKETPPPAPQIAEVQPPVAEMQPPVAETPPAEPVMEPPAVEQEVSLTPPPVVETPPPVAQEAAPVISEPPPAVVEAPVAVSRQRAPVWSFKVPDPFPEDGVDYQVRWGDTLWDISHVFYRTPWRYKYIADFNAIENPNRIVSGDWLVVPRL